MLLSLLQKFFNEAVLSGYDHPVYDPLDAAGWHRTEFQTACYAAGRTRTSQLQGEGAVLLNAPRMEVVWRSYDAQERIKGLF